MRDLIPLIWGGGFCYGLAVSEKVGFISYLFLQKNSSCTDDFLMRNGALSYSPKKKKKKKQFENPVIISTFLLLRKFLEVSRCHHKFICIRSLSTGVTALRDKGGGRELL